MSKKMKQEINFVKVYLIVGLITLYLLGLWAYKSLEDEQKLQSPAQTGALQLNREQENKIVLDYFWTRLWDCESSGMPDVKVLDSDGKYSYGPIMYHQATFDALGKHYNLPHDDIYSPIEQKAIFINAIIDGQWYLWYNCSKHIGLDKFKPYEE